MLRRRSPLYLSLTLAIGLMVTNIALMTIWIFLAARQSWWGTLTIGTIAFSLVLIGISIYLFLMIKEQQLNQRQINFVDAVTHELKSPISSLRLYLETLQLRNLDESKRREFYQTMDGELQRLDDLINQLLQVARLDAIGENVEIEQIDLQQAARRAAEIAAARHSIDPEQVFQISGTPCRIQAAPIVVDMILGNLLDNAIKYGGTPPRVEVRIARINDHQIELKVIDNGIGVPPDLRTRVFSLFFRGQNELERTTKGTGIGLFVAQTLVHKMKGTIVVESNPEGPGSVFRIELPCPRSYAESRTVPAKTASNNEPLESSSRS